MLNQRTEKRQEELLPAVTAQKVKNMIVSQKMKPGDRIPTETELSEQFGVSRSTLREAMKYLRAENVIVIRQGSGTFVSDYTGVGDDPLGLHFADQENLLRHLFETRMMIEPQIAALAVERATSQNIRDLENIIRKMLETEINDDSAAGLDIRFHTAVAECTHNDVLIRVVPIINESIVRSHAKTQEDAESYRRAKRSHVGIFDAIRDRDSIKARYFSERHIWETLNDIILKEEKV